ncbi:MAG: hypothetical protein ABSG75_11120 [Syntrophales bacterium]|jgi:hypothetical protein
MQAKRYTIGDKAYSQNKLVLGQIAQIVEYLEKENIEFTNVSPVGVIKTLGNQGLARCLAIILVPDGVSIQNKNIDELEKELFWAMDGEAVMEIATDFFYFNPVFSLFKKAKELMANVLAGMTAGVQENGSEKSSETSATETSQKETGLPGTSQ